MRYPAIFGTLVIAFILSSCQSSQKKPELKTLQDSVSYGVGMDFAKYLKGQMIEVNPDVLAQAIKDMNSNEKPMLSDTQAHIAMMRYQNSMMAEHSAKMKDMAEKGLKDGESYLSENKKKEGVVTLPSGVQYKVLKQGNGRKPGPKDNVSVNYKGSLIDGSVFDSSEMHEGPAIFPIPGLIKGLGEALQLMPVGSKWQIVIPSQLGYGDHPMGSQIPPNSVLVFDIELLSIQK